MMAAQNSNNPEWLISVFSIISVAPSTVVFEYFSFLYTFGVMYVLLLVLYFQVLHSS